MIKLAIEIYEWCEASELRIHFAISIIDPIHEVGSPDQDHRPR
jgi:hypothetical protein